MKEFPICFNDLNEEAQKAFLEFIGGEDEINDFIPIATIYVEEENE